MRSSIKPFKLVGGTARISTQALQQHSLYSGPSSEGRRALHPWALGSVHRARGGELGEWHGLQALSPQEALTSQ